MSTLLHRAEEEMKEERRSRAVAEIKHLLRQKHRHEESIVNIDDRITALENGAEPIQDYEYCDVGQSAKR